MQSAGRIHVEHGDPEDQPARESGEPAGGHGQRPVRTPPDHMVGLVDRLQERLQVRGGRRLGGREQGDDRLVEEGEEVVYPVVEPGGGSVDGDHARLDRTVLLPEPLSARGEGRFVGSFDRVGEQDQGHPRPLHRLAVKVDGEGVERVERLGIGHEAEFAPAPSASQASTASL